MLNLVIKPLMDRAPQGWNQFQISERHSLADSDKKVTGHGLVSVRLAKSITDGAFCGVKSRLPAFKSHRNTLNRVVPFHCAILVEESRRMGCGILS
jgi:hypothetical protein